MKKVLILNNEEIKQKTRRIAYQVVEDNYDVDELVIIGIKPNGYSYAQQLKAEIEKIEKIKVLLLELELNKLKPIEHEIKLELGKKSLDNKTVIVVDDVANTGKTLYYALKPVMEFSPRKVQAAVLVDRQHKLFPVAPDFVGLSLSTTMQEHIRVEFAPNGEGTAYLT
ncbi:MAG TPA: phosphoribosyltransferase family protein [Chitinophagales bacterium]|nr:phosphoribosyltransferase family protein [Chitinophagales bacterium]